MVAALEARGQVVMSDNAAARLRVVFERCCGTETMGSVQNDKVIERGDGIGMDWSGGGGEVRLKFVW